MNQSDPFDLDALRLDGLVPRPAIQEGKLGKPPRHRPGEWFLRGPVPWRWLDAAARLPGKALAVGLVLWREAGWRNRRTVPLCLARVGLGVSKQVARRGLRTLELAGLVSVVRKARRCSEVTLLDVAGAG
jgi:hypothetical protein